MKSLRRWCLLRDCVSCTWLARFSWLREALRRSRRCFARCATLTDWTCAAMRPARCATAWGRRGGAQRCTARVAGAAAATAASPGPSLSLEDSDKSLSTPVLELRPRGPYTDMLGCSMSRFSMGLASIRSSERPPAVKQGGGVTSQLSPEHARSGSVLISLPESLESG